MVQKHRLQNGEGIKWYEIAGSGGKRWGQSEIANCGEDKTFKSVSLCCERGTVDNMEY